MKNILSTILMLVCINLSYGQKKVSITIDDVPNTILYEADLFQSKLLGKLDSLSIPVAIFINEGLIYKTSSIGRNVELLTNWFEKDYMTVGNHTFRHSKYSQVGIDTFSIDVLKGAYISKELSKIYNKPLHYFRFPYNDLGKDSIEHAAIDTFLWENNYQITPFTIESSDWMYNAVYKHYLEKGDSLKANDIGMQYVNKTLEYFSFFENMIQSLYGRAINHIYLCHDNKLNADFLDLIIQRLSDRSYDFISLEEALRDAVYTYPDYYYKKWGVSWIYRWLKNHKERIQYMRQEPSTTEIEALFKAMQEN